MRRGNAGVLAIAFGVAFAAGCSSGGAEAGPVGETPGAANDPPGAPATEGGAVPQEAGVVPGSDGGGDGGVDGSTSIPLDPELDDKALSFVNKARCLPCDFDAKLTDLVTIDANANPASGSAGMFQIRSFVRASLRSLIVAASRPDDRLVVTSAYRSYATQVDTLQYWVDQDGACEATKASAPPGRSEHQLGVTVDIGSSRYGRLEAFASSPLAAWVRDHAHEHGFVMSYPHPDVAKNLLLTGYTHEPWHFRYVGRIAAKAIHDAVVAGATPISVDEFFSRKIPALGPWVPPVASAPMPCVACDPARGALSGCPTSAVTPLTTSFTCSGKARVKCELGLITCETCKASCMPAAGDDVCL